MSVSIESIKEALAECPICSEYFDEDARIPRRMPCCLQAICEPCLETYRRGRSDITCPLCREVCHLQGGVASLPKEMCILRFLNHLKTQSNLAPSCTDCPDNNNAMATCNSCSVFLCETCLEGHEQSRLTRSHSTTTFEQVRAKQLLRRFSSNQDTEDPNVAHKLTERYSELDRGIQELDAMNRNLQQSRKTAVDHVNKSFDDLVELLEERRGILLSLVESKVTKETNSISRAVESHRDLKAKLVDATENRSSSSLARILDEQPQDVDFARRGVCFLPSHIDHVTAIIRATGIIRTVTFTPTERPAGLAESSHCDAVNLEPADVPLDNDVNILLMSADSGLKREHITSSPLDQVVIIKDDKHLSSISCPYLEYDHSTSSDDVITSYRHVIRNVLPECTLPDTGCRLQAQRTVLLSPPLILHDGKRSMFQVKVNFRLKETVPDYKMIFELAAVNSPMDMGMTQARGLTVWIGTNPTQHVFENNVCLIVKYNRFNYFCRNISENKPGASHDLHLCLLFDEGRREVHVIEVKNAALLATVHDVVFDRPVWSLMYLGRPEWTDISGEVLSGNRVEVSKGMCELLSTL